MAQLLNTVAGRLTLTALLIHAVLLPLLMNGVLYVVRESNVDIFVNRGRIYGRFLADVIGASGAIDDDGRIVELLDSAVLSSDGVYAEVREGERSVLSSLVAPERRQAFKEDFVFGEHGDDVYYLSIPLQIPGHDAVLRLGLDEQATLDAIAVARQRVLWILGAYLGVSILLVLVLAVRLTQPLRVLRSASRSIASGRYADHLSVDTRIVEISQLANDLELMRSKLVGINRQLQDEIGERKAAEAQREILQAQLRHAQKLETIGTLAGGISHEFNNVLVPITLYSEAVLDDVGPDSRSGQHIARVLKAAARAKGLVQQILAFSRQGGPEQRGPVQVGPIVDEAVNLLRALLPASVDIRANVDMNAGAVLGDRAQLHQLVTNLCNNAYQALRSNGGCLRIELHRTTVMREQAKLHPDLHEGAYVLVSVIDDGHGMDPVTLQRIFEPFFTTRAVGEGTGLGLSVAHGIANAHGGTILVESELGRGSRFDVYLPVCPELAAPVSTPGAKVVYVSSDGSRADMHVRALRSMGYEISTPSDRADVDAALAGGDAAVDILIMDRGALDAMADRLMQLPLRPPTILLCELGDIITPAEQVKHGVAAYLVEPVEAADLAASIRGVLIGESAHG